MGKKNNKSGMTVTVPPEFASFSDTFAKLDVAQKASFVDMFETGEMTVDAVEGLVSTIENQSFLAKYLGSVPVAAAKLTDTMWQMFGSQVLTGTAFPRIKAMKWKPLDVKMVITEEGVRVLNEATEEDVEVEPFDQIVYSCLDTSDKKKFAFFSHYSKLGLIYCHVFSSKTSQAMVDIIQKFVEEKSKDELSEADRHLSATGATLGIFEAMVSFEHQNIPKSSNSNDAVAETVGEMVVDVKSRKKKKDKGEKPQAVVMVISSEGIRVVDAFTREVIEMIYITKISYVTKVVLKKDEYFAILIRKKTAGERFCILYSVKEADLICEKVKEASKVAKEDVKKRAGNPFIPMTALSEQIKGPLGECQIARRTLRPRKPLGAGQFGEVYLAELNDEDKHLLCAVKMLRGVATAADKKEFLDEALVMNELGNSNQNIVEFLGVCAQQRPWLAVLEFCDQGDLLGVVKNLRSLGKNLGEYELCRIGMNIANGLAFVAEKRYVHLDVAARNCLVANDGTVKIADFGLAHQYDEGKNYFRLRKTLKLSIRWLCAEALRPGGKRLTEFSDVWSFGVTMWEVVSKGRMPFASLRLAEVCHSVLAGHRLSQPSTCNDDIFAVMTECWNNVPASRPNFSTLVEKLGAIQKQFKPCPTLVEACKAEGEEDKPEQSLPNEMENLEEYLKQYDYPVASLNL
eukprot:m.11777 g.11777  ORF g.11777 m.11777 type:complete len:686 (-) comp3886_c0_seq1:183-2240(-)